MRRALAAALLLVAGAANAGTIIGVGWLHESYTTTTTAEYVVTQVIQHGQVWDHAGDPNAPNLDQIFTTSLPPYQWGPEVFPVYFGAPNPAIHIYGWSCTVAAPCDDAIDSPTVYPFPLGAPITAPGYVVFDVFLDRFPQWQFQHIDEHGHLSHAWRYRHTMTQSAGTMTITISFFNKNTGAWDAVWSHSRAEADPNCTIAEEATGGCGTWSQSYELVTPGSCDPAVCPPPVLTNEIGFEAAVVRYDGGGTSLLTPADTVNSPAAGHLGDTRIATWKVHTPTPYRSHYAGPARDPQVAMRSDSRRRGETTATALRGSR